MVKYFLKRCSLLTWRFWAVLVRWEETLHWPRTPCLYFLLCFLAPIIIQKLGGLTFNFSWCKKNSSCFHKVSRPPTDLFVVRRVDQHRVGCTYWTAGIGPWFFRNDCTYFCTSFRFNHLVGCSLIVGGRDEPISRNVDKWQSSTKDSLLNLFWKE